MDKKLEEIVKNFIISTDMVNNVNNFKTIKYTDFKKIIIKIDIILEEKNKKINELTNNLLRAENKINNSYWKID